MSFEQTCEALRPDLMAFARKRGCSNHIAEDLVQTTFERVWRNYRSAELTDGLFYTILVNCLRDHWRKPQWEELYERGRIGGNVEEEAMAKLELAEVWSLARRVPKRELEGLRNVLGRRPRRVSARSHLGLLYFRRRLRKQLDPA